MFNFLRKVVFKYFLAQIIVSKIYKIFYFLSNKKKINIYYENNGWVHETFLGKFVSTHPIRKTEAYLMSELPFFLKHYNCQRGDVIFDAGAGIGTEVIFFSKLVGPEGKVYALEANPGVYQYLLKTIKLNKLNNVIPINLAVFSKSNEKVKFSTDMHDWLGGKIDNQKGNIFVDTITFDELLKKYEIDFINFAKFNIEGAEKYLIDGENKFIKACRNVCISCHDFIEEDENSHTYKIIENNLHENNFNFLENNKGLKNIQKDKLFYIYASKEKKTKNKDNIFLNKYKFFKKILN